MHVCELFDSKQTDMNTTYHLYIDPLHSNVQRTKQWKVFAFYAPICCLFHVQQNQPQWRLQSEGNGYTHCTQQG